MRRHGLSALAIAATVALGLGTSFMPPALEARFTRSDDAIIILNADEVTWRGVYVTVSEGYDSPGPWRAYIHELGPGESFRLPYADLVGDFGAFDLTERPEAMISLDATGPEWREGARITVWIDEIPRERQDPGGSAP